MKELFEAYMRYGDLASEMLPLSESGAKSTLTDDDLSQLIERYEWFTVARILRARLSGELDYQTKLILATGRCPVTLVEPLADVIPYEVNIGNLVAETIISDTKPSGEPQAPKDLIDEFLALNNEQLKIKPDDKTSMDDISMPSIVSELTMVSEELANIYLDQGYKSTAIEIYSRLSLLNPEKSVYFASIIEKIK